MAAGRRAGHHLGCTLRGRAHGRGRRATRSLDHHPYHHPPRKCRCGARRSPTWTARDSKRSGHKSSGVSPIFSTFRRARGPPRTSGHPVLDDAHGAGSRRLRDLDRIVTDQRRTRTVRACALSAQHPSASSASYSATGAGNALRVHSRTFPAPHRAVDCPTNSRTPRPARARPVTHFAQRRAESSELDCCAFVIRRANHTAIRATPSTAEIDRKVVNNKTCYPDVCNLRGVRTGRSAHRAARRGARHGRTGDRRAR